jgi:hypothetical protein
MHVLVYRGALSKTANYPKMPSRSPLGQETRDSRMRLQCTELRTWTAWFAKVQRDVITRGIFSSVADLGNKLRKYIRAYSKSANVSLDLY